ncbi:hypothetical protein Tco_1237036 [Tanacetum coccineum]
MTPTLPKSQGPEASGALYKKRQKPKSKNQPTETKVTPPKPTKGSEQSHSVSSGTVPDPQDLKRNIQLASTGLPYTLDEGSRTVKTALHPEGSLGDKDSGGNKPPADMETINLIVVDLSGIGAKYQVDQTQSTRLRYQSLTKNKGKTSYEVKPNTEPLQLQTFDDVQAFLLSEDDLDKESDEEEVLATGRTWMRIFKLLKNPDLKKFDNTLPLTERQLIKYLRKMSRVLFNRIAETQWEQHKEAAVSYADLKTRIEEYYDKNVAHKDQIDKLVASTMSTLDKSSAAIKDIYQGLNVNT